MSFLIDRRNLDLLERLKNEVGRGSGDMADAPAMRMTGQIRELSQLLWCSKRVIARGRSAHFHSDAQKWSLRALARHRGRPTPTRAEETEGSKDPGTR
jgi:hypothetical protein